MTNILLLFDVLLKENIYMTDEIKKIFNHRGGQIIDNAITNKRIELRKDNFRICYR